MRFRSTILEADGSKKTLELEAEDEQSLHDRLHTEGRTLLRLRALGEGSIGDERRDLGEVRVTLTPRRLLLLTQAMQEALEAGVPLLMAFEALGEQEEDERLAALLEDLGRRVASGQLLSDAMAAHPRSFPDVYCALVQAGEHSGSLPRVLQSIAEFIEWKLEIGGVVKQAMIYPLVVLSAGYGMVLFMLSFVVPRLGGVLAKMGGDLPAASLFLISMSSFVAANITWILAGSVVGVVAIVLLTRTAKARDVFVDLMATFPVLRNIISTLAMAQFARTFAVLLEAGLTMTKALDLGGSAVASPHFREALGNARERVVGGARLGEALAEQEVLPPVALSMVRVGEEAGRLPITFERLGRLYDREVKSAVRRALGLLEPAVTVLLGLIVGGVAVLVVTTIYTAMKGIGK